VIVESGALRKIKEIELAQLELRYAHTRIERPEGAAALAASIERFGQIIPVIVLKEEMHVILLDGYLRVKALKTLGRDTGHRCGVGMQRRRSPCRAPRPGAQP
jgi:ParB-like chromosome segregation protein Spo0J